MLTWNIVIFETDNCNTPMEQQKTDIAICLGSSCFARGNKKLVQTVKQFLESNHLEDRVFFHGTHCFGECGSGPNLMVDGKFYQSIDAEKVQRILKEHFGI